MATDSIQSVTGSGRSGKKSAQMDGIPVGTADSDEGVHQMGKWRTQIFAGVHTNATEDGLKNWEDC